MAYPGDGSQDGKEGQWAGPPVGQRGPEAEAGLAVEGLTWLQKNLGADSGAGLYDLYLLYRKDLSLDYVPIIFNVKHSYKYTTSTTNHKD